MKGPNFEARTMEPTPYRGWIAACSARLQQQWPSIDPTRLDDCALDLFRDEKLRALEPEAAALEWLRRGVLAE